MKYTLKYYVDSVFEGTPDTEPVRELHDEILSNLEARYDDCINGGMSPQRAYAAVIGTMGDVSGLISQVSGSGRHISGNYAKRSKLGGLIGKYSYIFTDENLRVIKRTVITLIWLLSAVLFILAENSGGFGFIFIIAGAMATVFANMAGNIARYSRGEDTGSRSKLLKTVRAGVSGMMWLAVFGLIVLNAESGGNNEEFSFIMLMAAAAVQIVMNTVFKIQLSRFSE